MYLYLHSVYFVLCIIESEIRRVSRWETEAVEAAATHNVATPHQTIPYSVHNGVVLVAGVL